MSDIDNANESTRLLFESLDAVHASALFDALTDPAVNEHLNEEPLSSIEAMAELFARMAAGPGSDSSERWLNFAVRLKEERRWIGRIQATVHSDWAEVGYLFGRPDWGHGYAAESIVWLHHRLRSELNISEIWASVSPANIRSIRLLRRTGYEPIAVIDARQLDSYVAGDSVFRLGSQ